MLVELSFFSEVIKDFAIWPTRFAYWHVLRDSGSRPPVFLCIVIEDTGISHTITLRKISFLCINSHSFELFFPKRYRFVITRNTNIFLSTEHSNKKPACI